MKIDDFTKRIFEKIKASESLEKVNFGGYYSEENTFRKKSEPTQADIIIKSLFAQPEARKGYLIGKILANWNVIVGDNVANNCTPIDVKDKIMLIQTKSGVWAAQAKTLKTQIIKQVNDYVESEFIEDISISNSAINRKQKYR